MIGVDPDNGEALRCRDCWVEVHKIGEWFMVTDEIWQAAVIAARPAVTRFLCIGCLEERLGRRLTRSDFKPDLPINDPDSTFLKRSDRLRDRLTA